MNMVKRNDLRGRGRNLSQRSFIFFITVLLVLLGSTLAFGALTQEPNRQILEKAFNIQMPFIANQGQIADEHVRFYAKTFGGTVFVTDQGEIVYSLMTAEAKSASPALNPKDRHRKPEEVKVWNLREKLVDSLETVPKAVDRAEAKVNYFIGNDKSKWKTDVTTHNEVSLGEIYPGIELGLKAYGKNVEKIFTVAPGADPTTIKLKMDGVTSLKINEKEEIEIDGIPTYSKPVGYQEINGKRHEVKVTYLLYDSTPDTEHSSLTYGFAVGDYDKSSPLIIDPVLVYSSYLGGSKLDLGNSIAVDSSGSVYITGQTASPNFPLVNPLLPGTFRGVYDVFVTKMNPVGNTILYSTYLGGSGNEGGNRIAVDSSGSAYITGSTDSTDFPTANAYQSTYGGGLGDVFVTKMDPAGNAIVYSTYLGGSGNEGGFGIAVDGSGSAYITGSTNSPNFPRANAIRGTFQGGIYDAFVTKINPAGDTIAYSTYLGGTDADYGEGIAVDSSGSAYVTGYTNSSSGFPIPNAIQSIHGGGYSDAFVTKINSAGNAIVYSTYLGGSGSDGAFGIAVDSSGSAYVTGHTDSSNFPRVNPIQGTLGGSHDVFVTKINSAGSAIVYSTYLGGSGDDFSGFGIAVDSSGSAYITGQTNSLNFPTANPAQGAFGGYYDGFVTKINPAGDGIVYSTYLGGSGGEAGYGIAVDSSGSAYLTGETNSSNFPLVNPVQGALGGGGDAFVAKISGDLIDQTKWANLEYIRRAEDGGLHSAVRHYGSRQDNYIIFPNPNGVNEIQAAVTVNSYRNDGAFTVARLAGHFYSRDVGVPPNHVYRDTAAEVGIAEGAAGGLEAYYRIVYCTNDDCSLGIVAHAGTLKSIDFRETHTLYIGWDGNTQFTFKCDADVTAGPFSGGLRASGPVHPFKGIGTVVVPILGSPNPTPGGHIDAKFENVLANGSPTGISDINGKIDRSNWSDSALEFVREQLTDGVYGMALRSAGSFANDGLNLLNGKSVNELQADLTVEQLINNPSPDPATPMADLQGNFYNAGYTNPGDQTDQTDDVKALVGIRLGVASGPYSGQPVGFYNIVQCTKHDCSYYNGPADPNNEFVRLYYYEDPKTIGPDLVGKPHRVSIRYDAGSNTITFGFDGRFTTPGPSSPGWIVGPPLPTNSGPPNSLQKGPHTRVAFFNGPLGEGYVSAKFAFPHTPIQTTAFPAGGTYSPSVDVRLVSNEPAAIYYTTDGTTPTTSSPSYAGPISITSTGTTTLKFFGVDTTTGNAEPVNTEVYTVTGDLTGDLTNQTGTEVSAEFCNDTAEDIITIVPDCHNTFFALTDHLTGEALPPTCTIHAPYHIPDHLLVDSHGNPIVVPAWPDRLVDPVTGAYDITRIPAGTCFNVTCDLHDLYNPVLLPPNKTLDVAAVHSNYIEDPKGNYPLKVFSISTNAGTINTGAAGTTTSLAVQPVIGPYGGTVTLSATLTFNGSSLAGENVTFILDGTVMGSTITNFSGVATLTNVSLTGISAGTYRIVATFAGDSVYGSCIGSAQLTIHGYSFNGFLSPVDNPPITNTAKAGQTIPLKWQLKDLNGNWITNLSMPTINLTSCPSSPSGPTDAIGSYTGASGLQYLGNGNWQLNWQTKKTDAGKCLLLTLTLDDGTTYPDNPVIFSLK